MTEHHLEFLSLKGGCTGSSEFTLVKIPHVVAHNGPRREKTCLREFANNTGAEQPAHSRSLISVFVFAFWKVPYLSLLQEKFQFPSLETGFSLALLETPVLSRRGHIHRD